MPFGCDEESILRLARCSGKIDYPCLFVGIFFSCFLIELSIRRTNTKYTIFAQRDCMMHPCLKERFVIICYLILHFSSFQVKDMDFYVIHLDNLFVI